MNRIKVVAFILIVGLNGWLLWDRAQLSNTLEEKEENFQSIGSSLLDCADDLMECKGHCTREAAAAFERGNQIFECEESICRINGWTPPEDHPTRAEWEADHPL